MTHQIYTQNVQNEQLSSILTFFLLDRLKKLERERELKGIGWGDLAKNLPITGNALRIAFTRGSVKESYLVEVEKVLGDAAGKVEEEEITYKTRSGKNVSLDEIALLASKDTDNFFTHKFFANEIEKRVAKRLLELTSSPEKFKEFLNS